MVPFFLLFDLTGNIDIDEYKRKCHKASLKGTSGIIVAVNEDTNDINKIFLINEREKVTTDILLKRKDKIFDSNIKNNIGKIDNIYVMDKKMACDNNLVRLCSLHGVKIRIISNIIEDKEIVDIM